MQSYPTIFDFYKSAAATALKRALRDDNAPIKDEYVDKFCLHATNLLWRDIDNGIACAELYGDIESFVFNLGGYIDAYHDLDNIRWHGFTEQQENGLIEAYPQVVEMLRKFAIDIIEMYRRSIVPHDIEQAINEAIDWNGKDILPRFEGTFRNRDKIAFLCREGKPTAEDIYEIFLNEVKRFENLI